MTAEAARAPGRPAGRMQAAVAAHRRGDMAEALRHYAAHLERAPEDAAAWSNLGALHRAEGRPDQALRAHARAHAAAPDTPSVLRNYANVLGDVGRYDEAIALRERLLALHAAGGGAGRPAPGEAAEQKAMVGRALRGKGDYAAAIDWLERALAEHPGDAEIELQLAFALLGDGQYRRGFEAYRVRWRTAEMKPPPELPFPRWADEDLAGRHVLVLPEQGFGDAVLMMRFLPALRRRAARVSVLAERPMARLFSGLEGADLVSSRIGRNLDADLWLPAMDLPRLGLEGPRDVPPPARLSVPGDSAGRARMRVERYRERFRVGVNWSGSATYRGNAYRSLGHADLLGLSEIPGVQLFSLYKGPFLDAYRADGSDAFILDAAGDDRDFADCAATMAQMDLIVTSDTATAHIAGSMGLPTWVLLHWDPFWVYSHGGRGTPWYPSMRLFRQREPRDWSRPLDEVRAALERRVADWNGERGNG